MKSLEFKNVENKIYPNLQLLSTFFISRVFLERGYVEVRPLTIGHLLFALSRNYSILLYWRFLRCLFKLGFIDIPEATPFSWKYFRWRFWKPLSVKD